MQDILDEVVTRNFLVYAKIVSRVDEQITGSKVYPALGGFETSNGVITRECLRAEWLTYIFFGGTASPINGEQQDSTLPGSRLGKKIGSGATRSRRVKAGKIDACIRQKRSCFEDRNCWSKYSMRLLRSTPVPQIPHAKHHVSRSRYSIE